MKKKIIAFISIVCLFLTTNYNIAFAKTAYIRSDENLTESYNRQYYVGNALSKKLSVNTIYNTYFSKSDILDNLKYPYVIYYNGHGGNWGNCTVIQSANGNTVTSNEISQIAFGHYNIVYFATCHVGETSHMANAFGISSSENEAMIGFSNTIKANWNQTVFDKTVFEKLADGNTINDSVWASRVATGITNYNIYGNYSATLEY